MKSKDFYEELKKAGFTKCNQKMYDYNKKLGLEGFNIEDIPLYLEHSNNVKKGAINPWNKGKHFSEETRKKMSEAHIGKQVGINNPFYGKHHSEKTKQTLSNKLKGRVSPNKGLNMSEKQKQKISNTKQLNPWKPTFEQRKKISEGLKGHLTSEETKKKISEANKGVNYWSKGRLLSEETKQRLSRISTARAKKGLRQSIKYDGVLFDSKWEIIFYEYWKKKNAVIERNIECELPSGRHTLIDFRINGQLYEVKGTHFFNKEGEYIIPFNNPNKIQDPHSKEKQEYWKNNNVIVVSDIKPYI